MAKELEAAKEGKAAKAMAKVAKEGRDRMAAKAPKRRMDRMMKNGRM